VTQQATETAPDSPPDGFDVRRHVSGMGAVLAGPANVIMQLSWPQVGYGVAESVVESGSAMRHPAKRARTTFTYLAVALLGDEEDRRAFRQAVNGQHRQVRSTASSPVAYRAMDPRLQLWVAACLCYGTVDLLERVHGPLDDASADALYRHCARFGTTLQVAEDHWPPDRRAFEDYWEASLREVHIDATIRDYLMALTNLENLPLPFRLLRRRNVFFTTGFLPSPCREMMGLEWTEADGRRFDRHLRRLGALEDRLPMAVRLFPFNALLWDMRRRRRAGRPLV
jgi:uncharacterized protein (DUF2236 family)